MAKSKKNKAWLKNERAQQKGIRNAKGAFAKNPLLVHEVFASFVLDEDEAEFWQEVLDHERETCQDGVIYNHRSKKEDEMSIRVINEFFTHKLVPVLDGRQKRVEVTNLEAAVFVTAFEHYSNIQRDNGDLMASEDASRTGNIFYQGPFEDAYRYTLFNEYVMAQ